jgi:tRNA pseudouridine38-40 synthase
VRGTNTFLPPDIAVQWAQPVPDSFHSRASALARRYAYVLLESPVRPSVDSGRVGWVFRPLDRPPWKPPRPLCSASTTSPRSAPRSCQAKSPVKTHAPH